MHPSPQQRRSGWIVPATSPRPARLRDVARTCSDGIAASFAREAQSDLLTDLVERLQDRQRLRLGHDRTLEFTGRQTSMDLLDLELPPTTGPRRLDHFS